MKTLLTTLALVLTLASISLAADPVLPACCGEQCKAMGPTCCKTDDKGKASCNMGGNCCEKPAATKPATAPK